MIRFDVRSWVIWLVAGSALAMITTNPLYLVSLILVSRIVGRVCSRPEEQTFPLPFWRMAGTILIFSTLFNMLMVHAGATVLMELPETWWLVGGTITLEAAVMGFINGLRLVAILSFFLAFNAIVPVSQLVSLAPSALHETGLIIIIALTFFPETVVQWRQISEAQAIRGHQVRGLTGWRPLLIPLLVGGLERAMNLSETMVARGYGTTQPVALKRRWQAVFLVGLLLAIIGVIVLLMGNSLGWFGLISGSGLVLYAFRRLGLRVTHTTYRNTHWSMQDTLFAAFSISPVLVAFALPVAGIEVPLTYSAFEQLTLPDFSPLFELSLLGLVFPALAEVWQ